MKLNIETFSSVLIANRGEIAARIIKTAKKFGIKTFAVYTLPDKNSPHVRLADHAVLIGDGPIAESYLSIPKIIKVAVSLKVDAIHPGYGFLSENVGFAEACEKNKIIFIGPRPDSIKIMSNKTEAKKIAMGSGIPCIPGAALNTVDPKKISAMAREIGYPLMIKAANGGGGKGMRLVNDENELQKATVLAKAESLNSFGSDEIIFERALLSSRHVEIQIFGDSYGNVIHLGERDCSVQRRHQKIVEEAPCPVMTKKLRHSMGTFAVKIAKKVNYLGAGTVEFLVEENENFYFLEMNTRLQVEHPITELITDLDLVYLQFLIADGKALPLKQNEIKLKGHAIEVRLYAEDPAQDFLPSSGTLDIWSIQASEGVRVDNGVTAGSFITPFYDPLIAKVIGHGNTRVDALNNLIDALGNTSIMGIKNNRNFLLDLLRQKDFRDGLATTSFVEETYANNFADQSPSTAEYALIGAFIYQKKLMKHLLEIPNMCDELIGWSNNKNLKSTLLIQHSEEIKRLHVAFLEQNKFLVQLGNEHFEVFLIKGEIRVNEMLIHLVSFNTIRNMHQIITNETDFCFTEIYPSDKISVAKKTGSIRAPMHGVVTDVFVRVGDVVKSGDCLLILEAMKMQHELTAPMDGSVVEIFAKKTDQISVDDHLIEIQPNKRNQ